jgi:hypothetical protein
MWFLNSLARRTLSRYALFNAYVFSDFKEWKTRENTQKSNKMGGELAVV